MKEALETSIGLRRQTKKRLQQLKLDWDFNSIDDVITVLLDYAPEVEKNEYE